MFYDEIWNFKTFCRGEGDLLMNQCCDLAVCRLSRNENFFQKAHSRALFGAARVTRWPVRHNAA
jgi:hypothetical protein